MSDLTVDERAELHALRDLRQTVIGFGGDDFTIMPWVDAHRLHERKDEPYIGCVFCRDQFIRRSEAQRIVRDTIGAYDGNWDERELADRAVAALSEAASGA